MTAGPAAASAALSRRPRLGFLGIGWIGRHRLAAIRASGTAEVAIVADTSDEAVAQALEVAPEARAGQSLDDMLSAGVDGVVIATPSALHAPQSIAALRSGAAVFCQKPLGRTPHEIEAVIAAARRADRLLGVDLCYRRTRAMAAVHELVRSGELGPVFAAELVFHNAYGPDKPWFYDRALSGGGCLADLGVHLIDLALWTLGFPEVTRIHGHLAAGGRPATAGGPVEDFAQVTMQTADGCLVTLSCSWNLHAGRDAVIGVRFFGERGAVEFRNLDGSFYDFAAERFRGTARETLWEGEDAWGGRTAVDWARRLAADPRFCPAVQDVARSGAVIGEVYRRAGIAGNALAA